VHWNLSLTELGLDGNFFSPEDPQLGTCVSGKLPGKEKNVCTLRCRYRHVSLYFSLQLSFQTFFAPIATELRSRFSQKRLGPGVKCPL